MARLGLLGDSDDSENESSDDGSDSGSSEESDEDESEEDESSEASDSESNSDEEDDSDSSDSGDEPAEGKVGQREAANSGDGGAAAAAAAPAAQPSSGATFAEAAAVVRREALEDSIGRLLFLAHRMEGAVQRALRSRRHAPVPNGVGDPLARSWGNRSSDLGDAQTPDRHASAAATRCSHDGQHQPVALPDSLYAQGYGAGGALPRGDYPPARATRSQGTQHPPLPTGMHSAGHGAAAPALGGQGGAVDGGPLGSAQRGREVGVGGGDLGAAAGPGAALYTPPRSGARLPSYGARDLYAPAPLSASLRSGSVASSQLYAPDDELRALSLSARDRRVQDAIHTILDRAL